MSVSIIRHKPSMREADAVSSLFGGCKDVRHAYRNQHADLGFHGIVTCEHALLAGDPRQLAEKIHPAAFG